jgi:hypothetical protein
MGNNFLTRSARLAVILLIPMLVAWEWHWRGEGYPRSPDDNRHLWAENRASVSRFGPEDVVLLGSSRVFYDIQLDEWEAVTGRRPFQLAIAGSSPMPVLQDILENTDFNGTLLIGVSPPLYFLGAGPGLDFWDRPVTWVEHFHDRTFAQRFNHWVGKPFQMSFAFLENDEDEFYNDLDLRTLVNRIPLKGRVPEAPPFPYFGYVDADRNMTMLDAVTSDTSYAGKIKRTWQYFIAGGPPPDSAWVVQQRETVLQMSVDYLERFRARGGQVIFVRCPSSGWFRMVENMGFPRAHNWDVLLEQTGARGYHFEDYPFLNKYEPPEWSHLATPDARQFTTDLVTQMKKDGVLR